MYGPSPSQSLCGLSVHCCLLLKRARIVLCRLTQVPAVGGGPVAARFLTTTKQNKIEQRNINLTTRTIRVRWGYIYKWLNIRGVTLAGLNSFFGSWHYFDGRQVRQKLVPLNLVVPWWFVIQGEREIDKVLFFENENRGDIAKRSKVENLILWDISEIKNQSKQFHSWTWYGTHMLVMQSHIHVTSLIHAADSWFHEEQDF